MAFNNPSVADFKTQFFRDFPFGTDPATSVVDQDILNAFTMVNVNVSTDLFADQSSYSVGYLLLTAHFLVMSLRASSLGLNGQFNLLQTSKSVGSVSESFTIPQRFLDNPDWAMFMQTAYGAAYMQMILPQLVGQIFSVYGTTQV